MSENSNLKNKSIASFFWKFLERIGAHGVSFIVSIVLARLLSPNDYGLISLITIFITIFNVFVDCGLGTALVQKKDADDLDFSSVFYCNVVFCLALYFVLFFSAPLIAAFYAKPELIPIIRVLGISLIISGLRSIQNAYVAKHMIFKKFFFATMFGTVGAAAIGITMAYLGFGVWALVSQQLFNGVFGAVVLWITVRWRPKKMFSFERLKGLFSYGWKLLTSSLLNTVYTDIRKLIIGKFSPADLGFYDRGNQFPALVVDNVNTSIDGVLLPVLSQCQTDKSQVKSITRKAIRTSGYIMWPLMMGLMVVGENMVTLLLTEIWLPCLPFLYIACFTYGMTPVQTANLNAIKAMGRSDLYLVMEIIKKSIGLSFVVIAANINIIASWFGFGNLSISDCVLAIGLVGIPMTLVSSVVNIFPNKKLLGYGYKEQLLDMLPNLLLSAVMAVAVFLVGLLPLPRLPLLILQVLTGAAVYLLESILFKVETFSYLINTFEGFIKK